MQKKQNILLFLNALFQSFIPTTTLFNHILKWCKEALRPDELNSYFHSHHKCTRTCHFGQGIIYIQQITGHKHQNIQSRIIATIMGIVDAEFVYAVYGLINLIY